MSKHRSLADVMQSDPKKLEFIRGGKPAEPSSPQASESKAEPNQTEPKQTEPAGEPDNTTRNDPEEANENLKEQQPPQRTLKTTRKPKRPAANKEKPQQRTVAVEPQPLNRPSLTQAVVPVTTRFRQSTAEALRRASLERKLAGQSPCTQQEIIEQSVTSWLHANGYLDSIDGE